MSRKLLISKKEAVQKILRYVGQKQGLVGTVWAVWGLSAGRSPGTATSGC